MDQRLVKRRRSTNWGLKPGNIRDFCARWGENYEFMVLLDADSIMSGETIVRLVGIMENNPRLLALDDHLDQRHFARALVG